MSSTWTGRRAPAMDLGDIRAVNELFRDLYPYIARQVLEAGPRQEGLGLELGPFAPGISMALARLCPAMRFVIADDYPGVDEYVQEVIAREGLAARMQVERWDKFALPIEEAVDLVVFRGGLFFWGDEATLLQGIYRALRPGGLALVGGGYGAGAPDEVVDALMDQSRDLNLRLGKWSLSIGDVRRILAEAGLAEQARIDRRRGLWVILRKR